MHQDNISPQLVTDSKRCTGVEEPVANAFKLHGTRWSKAVRVAGPATAGAKNHPILGGAGSVVGLRRYRLLVSGFRRKSNELSSCFQAGGCRYQPQIGGTGLGRPSRELASVLGGEIPTFKCTTGKGSTSRYICLDLCGPFLQTGGTRR